MRAQLAYVLLCYMHSAVQAGSQAATSLDRAALAYVWVQAYKAGCAQEKKTQAKCCTVAGWGCTSAGRLLSPGYRAPADTPVFLTEAFTVHPDGSSWPSSLHKQLPKSEQAGQAASKASLPIGVLLCAW